MGRFVPLAGSARLGEKIAASTLSIIGSQEPGGYIGNYAPANRYSRGWDVWGTKYTLMGLMHYYDYAVRDPSLKPSAAKALEAGLPDRRTRPQGAHGTPFHGLRLGRQRLASRQPLPRVAPRPHPRPHLLTV